jgi:hypothetical protein
MGNGEWGVGNCELRKRSAPLRERVASASDTRSVPIKAYCELLPTPLLTSGQILWQMCHLIWLLVFSG